MADALYRAMLADHVIADPIEVLRVRVEQADAALRYMSDHGIDDEFLRGIIAHDLNSARALAKATGSAS